MNLYSYVNGNPIRYSDPLGLWSTEAHDYFIGKLFTNELSPDQIAQVKAGSAFADTPRFQFAPYSYMHSMSSSKLSKEEARREKCKFVKGMMADFWRLVVSTNPSSQNLAYFKLGMALHPIMDSTSSVHRGYQKWNGSPSQIRDHGKSHTGFASREDIDSAPMYLNETISLMSNAVKGQFDDCGCQ